MCGIVGMVSHAPVNQDLFDGLTVLQHRGQDAAGIMTCDNDKVYLRKSNGLVRDVFRTRHMCQLIGHMGIGHVRYPTAGTSSQAEAQPFYVNSPYGIALAHNGNLINTEQVKQELWQADLRHLNTTSDSEVILNVFAQKLQQLQAFPLTEKEVFAAVKAVHERCIGAYAVVVLIAGFGIVGFRDPHGIRPLVLGVRRSNEGLSYLLASESVALKTTNHELVGDVAPGEAICIRENGTLSRQQCAAVSQCSPCIFEHVYFARPDSLMDGISVYKVRLKLGDLLAKKIEKQWPDHDIDVVMPVPDTSRTAAFAMAQKLGIKFREGLVKNHYIGRTFIMPGQKVRRKSVRQKLNTLELEFQGKNVLLVDDSIVRGTTSKEIVDMAREAGANKVYFASAAPPVRFPNVYGIDMPAAEELIAHDRTEQEICQRIGADKLIFQDLEALHTAAHEGNPGITRFEDSVFTGKYVTGHVDEAYLKQLAAKRNDAAKQTKCDAIQAVDVANDDS